MTRDSGDAFYHRYIDALNGRHFDLTDFVHDALSYNGRPMTRADYEALIADDVAAIPDLWFTIERLLIDGDDIASRLLFDCTPVAPFIGLQPDGGAVRFAENVFYRLREGRIAEVWSLIDRDAIRAQMAARAAGPPA